MWPFTCNHPFKYLAIDKEQTEIPKDDDFSLVKTHLFCTNCHKSLTIKHAKLLKTVKQFLNLKGINHV